MAAEGAQVAVLDLNADHANAVADEVDGLSYGVDVTDFDALSGAILDASERMRGVSLLYNNAGGSSMAAIHDWDLAEWQRIVTLNLTGVFHGFKAVAPLILESGGGAIVSTASISGTRPAAGEAPYAAAKAAVAALTASAALEYAPTVRVNAVSPGMIATPMTTLLLEDRGLGREKHMVDKTPLARVGQPGDIADVANEHNVDPQTVVDALVAAATKRLDAAVAAGRISSDRASKIEQRLPDRITKLVNTWHPKRFRPDTAA